MHFYFWKSGQNQTSSNPAAQQQAGIYGDGPYKAVDGPLAHALALTLGDKEKGPYGPYFQSRIAGSWITGSPLGFSARITVTS
jgi:hypothetical protein